MKITNPIRTEWLPDGRNMKLLEASTFIGSKGQRWEVCKGDIVNGANIPRVVWFVEGAPYTGLHRVPSVFHDVYCMNRTRPHRQVHKMFYDCMIHCGMDRREAVKKYLAVKHFGPKWANDGTVIEAVPLE